MMQLACMVSIRSFWFANMAVEMPGVAKNMINVRSALAKFRLELDWTRHWGAQRKEIVHTNHTSRSAEARSISKSKANTNNYKRSSLI